MDERISTFDGLLAQHRSGGVIDDITAELRTLIEAIKRTGKPGKISLTLTFKPISGGETPQIEITDKVVVTKPDPNQPASVFYSTAANDLSRFDPRQPVLTGLKEIPKRSSTGEGA